MMSPLSIRRLMTLVLVVALGIAAMKNASAATSTLAMSLMFAGLLVSALGAIVGRSPTAAWQGFALFGWAYFAVTFLRPDLGWAERSPLPTGALVTLGCVRLHPFPESPREIETGPVPQLAFDRNGELIVPPRAAPPSEDEIEEAKLYYKLKEAYNAAFRARDRRVEHARRIGHASLTLVFGCLGSIVGRAMAPTHRGRTARPPDNRHTGTDHSDVMPT